MSLPLYRDAVEQRPTRETDGHAGLWFDKFCDTWIADGSSDWTMKGGDGNNPKMLWIDTLTSRSVGVAKQIRECALRITGMIESRSGRWQVFTTASRFVTGLGRSHPVENGFAWHPTLGTPYLPGSSVKGLVRAWAKAEGVAEAQWQRLFGTPGNAGSVCLLDAVPTVPVRLEADVMTPHYAGWTRDDPPGDWRSPTPIAFLVTAARTPFLFGIIPCRTASEDDLDAVTGWLCEALAWAGGGAKTAVGYGRFDADAGSTNDLRQLRRDLEQERQERIQAACEADERARRLAALSPIEREIEQLLASRQNRNESEIITIVQAVERGCWTGAAKIEVATWIERRMRQEGRWKEKSGKKNPAKDRDHWRTLRVLAWLSGN